MTLNALASARARSYLLWGAAASAATLLFYCLLLRPIIRSYFPTGDELALEVVSTPIGAHLNPASWFTQGFHFYFVPYPEWGIANTNFWRPLANVLFWTYYQLFGTHWSDQLVVGYLAHALVVALTGYIAYCQLKLNGWLTALAMLIAAFNPAMWAHNEDRISFSYNTAPELIQYPVFQDEMLCTLLMLCAYIAFLHGRFVLLCALATVALLLKETALTVPIAAMMLIGVWWRPDPGRAARNFLWLILPLIVWYAVRLAVFDYRGSVYVLSSASRWRWLLKPIRNLLFLPTFLYMGPLQVTREAIQQHRIGVLALQGYQLAVNSAWWLALLYALGRVYQQLRSHGLQALSQPWICGLVFALGNLGLVVLLQVPDPRLAYFWFTLGPAALFASLADRRYGILAASLIALTLVIPQFWSVSRTLSSAAMQSYYLSKHAATQLVKLLAGLPPGVHTVYLVDDVVLQGTSPQYLAEFAGYPGRLVIVNTVAPTIGCQVQQPVAARYALARGQADTVLDYHAPPCFYQHDEAPLPLLYDQQVARGQWMTYRFPELKLEPSQPLGQDYDMGEQWSVAVEDPTCAVSGACVWLGLDLARQAYYVLP
ncbi:MAG: hypothetical protein ACRESY_03900 [Steroidobacteraceae bacterium]